MHCEGIMSGELKHGPLAMVDKNRSIVMVICSDNVYNKSINALQQVLARDGDPIIIADSDVPENDLKDRHSVLRVPKTVDCIQNILTVIPLQLLSYHVAELKGLNVSSTGDSWFPYLHLRIFIPHGIMKLLLHILHGDLLLDKAAFQVDRPRNLAKSVTVE
ncbi:unnamed protein product [Onchocerca flexuosa]|uniref:Glutamine--fructose-6-phosphate transaminase (isomerizing) n=1 Tax=Onchocerca flexuosa TaxID=387005 RepID=A0A183H3X6_9BILA|nr:unnamed protein product [Onchocerca flexuosa]